MLHFIEPDVQEMWSRLKTTYDGTYALCNDAYVRDLQDGSQAYHGWAP